MATIIVEDGSGLTNSNSYISEAELSTFATDRGVTLSGTASVLLIKAMDYIETLCFIGTKYNEEQALQWTRDGVYIDGYYIERSTIPQQLKDAQAWMAISIDSGVNPFDTLDRVARREKLDVMEVEYATGSASREQITSFNLTIQKLLCGGGSASSFSVVRA